MNKKTIVNLKSNLALKSNKGHNLLKSVFPQIIHVSFVGRFYRVNFSLLISSIGNLSIFRDFHVSVNFIFAANWFTDKSLHFFSKLHVLIWSFIWSKHARLYDIQL